MGEHADRGHYAPRVPNLQAGSYVLGPENGTLSVRTRRTGAAAKAGHDLLLHVTAWEARLVVGTDVAGTSLELDVDATSLRVMEGTGGMKALDDDDKANIDQTIDEEVLKRQDVTFRSTRIRARRRRRLQRRGRPDAARHDATRSRSQWLSPPTTRSAPRPSSRRATGA